MINLYSFISLPKATIRDFEEGRINKQELIEHFCSSRHILFDEMFEVINCTLETLAPDNPAVPLIGDLIELLAGGDGEALLLETYTFADKADCGCEICEPAGYKTNLELDKCVEFMDSVSPHDFEKAFSIKKALKETSLSLYIPKSVKNQKDLICRWAYEEMRRLRDFYNESAKREHYVVLIRAIDDDILSLMHEAAIENDDTFDVNQEPYGKWLELFEKNKVSFS
ncbi:MAG: hypothetical protein LBT27_02865 [Prevotellaceae bacterium]|jgi:hypothetical protein|nr:hypothetical protein [Prevotellaceae bacterium]